MHLLPFASFRNSCNLSGNTHTEGEAGEEDPFYDDVIGHKSKAFSHITCIMGNREI